MRYYRFTAIVGSLRHSTRVRTALFYAAALVGAPLGLVLAVFGAVFAVLLPFCYVAGLPL